MGAFRGLSGVLVGFGAGLAASSALPGAGAALRPVAKGLVRGALGAVDALRHAAAEASEQLSDLIAEVRAESAEESADGGEPRATDARRPRTAGGKTGPRAV